MKKAVEELNIIHEFSSVTDHVTISLGVATIQPHDGDTNHHEVVKEADKLLYQAKEMGRNQLVVKDFVTNR